MLIPMKVACTTIEIARHRSSRRGWRTRNAVAATPRAARRATRPSGRASRNTRSRTSDAGNTATSAAALAISTQRRSSARLRAAGTTTTRPPRRGPSSRTCRARGRQSSRPRDEACRRPRCRRVPRARRRRPRDRADRGSPRAPRDALRSACANETPGPISSRHLAAAAQCPSRKRPSAKSHSSGGNRRASLHTCSIGTMLNRIASTSTDTVARSSHGSSDRRGFCAVGAVGAELIDARHRRRAAVRAGEDEAA